MLIEDGAELDADGWVVAGYPAGDGQRLSELPVGCRIDGGGQQVWVLA